MDDEGEQLPAPPSIESVVARLGRLAADCHADLATTEGWKTLALSLLAEHDRELKFKAPVRVSSSKQLAGSEPERVGARVAVYMALSEDPGARRLELEGWESAPTTWLKNRESWALDRVIEEERERSGIAKLQTRNGNPVETHDYHKLKDRIRASFSAFKAKWPEYFSDITPDHLPDLRMTPLEKLFLSRANHMSRMRAAAGILENWPWSDDSE